MYKGWYKHKHFIFLCHISTQFYSKPMCYHLSLKPATFEQAQRYYYKSEPPQVTYSGAVNSSKVELPPVSEATQSPWSCSGSNFWPAVRADRGQPQHRAQGNCPGCPLAKTAFARVQSSIQHFQLRYTWCKRLFLGSVFCVIWDWVNIREKKNYILHLFNWASLPFLHHLTILRSILSLL